MNRLHHLQKTLPANIESVYNTGNVQIEFVVLNYNSNDGIEDWVLDNLQQHIKSGVLKFYTYKDAEYFDRSHSRNMAFKLATGDIVCNVDADNYIGSDFHLYVVDEYKISFNKYMTPAFQQRDIIGKICLPYKDFIFSKGYNEAMSGYGFEDLEFYARLTKGGLNHVIIKNINYLQAIRHSHSERYQNEFFSKNILSAYIKYNNPWSSDLLFFNKNGVCELGTIINNQLMPNSKSDKIGNREKMTENMFSIFNDEPSHLRLHRGWEVINWRMIDNVLYFNDQITNSIVMRGKFDKFNRLSIDKVGLFRMVKDRDLISAIILLKTELSNRNMLNKVFVDEFDLNAINVDGFGLGSVICHTESGAEIVCIK